MAWRTHRRRRACRAGCRACRAPAARAAAFRGTSAGVREAPAATGRRTASCRLLVVDCCGACGAPRQRGLRAVAFQYGFELAFLGTVGRLDQHVDLERVRERLTQPRDVEAAVDRLLREPDRERVVARDALGDGERL